ncbi:MAG TPA: hypothetical protein VFI37_01355 [Gaiellaceae bacterium]|nr:hypothetical protein [Gaiellaceae bacterium]
MTARRAFSLGLVLASLLVGGRSLLPHAAGDEAGEVAAVAAFLPASAALEARARTGSYVGAELPPASPVRIVWAGDTGYCLQDGDLYELGPGGVPQQGACPVEG